MQQSPKRGWPGLVLGVALLMSAAPPVLADDFDPPPWRGAPGSTSQRWEFSSPANPVAPDAYDNSWGVPVATVNPYGPWQPGDPNGRQGIWPLSGSIELRIPNTPWPYTKLIWLQLTWRPSVNTLPPSPPALTLWDPADALWPIVEEYTEPLQDGWNYSLYIGKIIPNPRWERIVIEGNIDVDQIVVDTICIPEAGPWGLAAGLGLLGLAFCRRASRGA